jgi:hypothetical protein
MKLVPILEVPIGGYFFMSDAGVVSILKRVEPKEKSSVYPVSAVEVDLALDPECKDSYHKSFSGDWKVLV